MRIVILTTSKQASDLSTAIHEYLTANRQGYNADKWSDLNKSDSEEKWMVKIPNDYPYKGDTVDKLPDNWRKEQAIQQ